MTASSGGGPRGLIGGLFIGCVGGEGPPADCGGEGLGI